MLKLMKRRNNVKRDLDLFEELSSFGYALGTDFITGHPGETQELWDEAYSTLKKFPLTHIHSFVYSKRDGTPSARMKPEIRGDEAKRRLQDIEALVTQKNYEFRKNSRVSLEILVEEEKTGIYTGYDQFYNKISIQSERDILKEWVTIDKIDVKKEGNYAKFQI